MKLVYKEECTIEMTSKQTRILILMNTNFYMSDVLK